MRSLERSLPLYPIAMALALAACARTSDDSHGGPAPSGAPIAAPSASAHATDQPSATSAAPLANGGADAGSLLDLGLARRCTPLDQVLARTHCVLPKDGKLVFPEGWNAARESPPCLPAAAPSTIRVILQKARSTEPPPAGSERCGWDYLLRVPALQVEEALCGSGCGPYSFVATRVAAGVAFECSEDMQNTEGLVEFKAGALVRQIWGNRPAIDWRAYPLPCRAKVVFEPHSQAFTGSSL